MEFPDLSALPPPVLHAVLDLLEALRQTCAQAQPETQQGESPPRFPRRPLELLILETLELIAPMPVTPVQMTVLINQPHDVVRDTLNALAVLGTIQHLRAGYYGHGPAVGDVPFRSRKKGGGRPPPPEVHPPSAHYAARIARIVAQWTSRETGTATDQETPGDEPGGNGNS
jgi:hypothetical protein